MDFDQSANEGRFVVKPQIDEELDELKRTYHGLDDLLVSLPPGSVLLAERLIENFTVGGRKGNQQVDTSGVCEILECDLLSAGI